MFSPGAFGTLGVGGGFALGAKLCRPDSEVGSNQEKLHLYDVSVMERRLYCGETDDVSFIGMDCLW